MCRVIAVFLCLLFAAVCATAATPSDIDATSDHSNRRAVRARSATIVTGDVRSVDSLALTGIVVEAKGFSETNSLLSADCRASSVTNEHGRFALEVPSSCCENQPRICRLQLEANPGLIIFASAHRDLQLMQGSWTQVDLQLSLLPKGKPQANKEVADSDRAQRIAILAVSVICAMMLYRYRTRKTIDFKPWVSPMTDQSSATAVESSQSAPIFAEEPSNSAAIASPLQEQHHEETTVTASDSVATPSFEICLRAKLGQRAPISGRSPSSSPSSCEHVQLTDAVERFLTLCRCSSDRVVWLVADYSAGDCSGKARFD
jgi:hypothetical protein